MKTLTRSLHLYIRPRNGSWSTNSTQVDWAIYLAANRMTRAIRWAVYEETGEGLR